MPVPESVLAKIPEHDCRRLISEMDIGRVVISLDAMPVAFPVNYRVIDGAIVFRTAAGTKLTAAANHNVVGFEVDEINRRTHTGWSVLIVGTAQVVNNHDKLARFKEADILSWLGNDLPHYIEIQIATITGRRLDR